MAEYKSALEYIKSDKFKTFHKERRTAKSKALAKTKDDADSKKWQAYKKSPAYEADKNKPY